jgi:hypothetical protein
VFESANDFDEQQNELKTSAKYSIIFKILLINSICEPLLR